MWEMFGRYIYTRIKKDISTVIFPMPDKMVILHIWVKTILYRRLKYERV